MAKYYEVTLRYEKMGEEGKQRKVSEKYLCDALSLTEAEAIATERMKPYISGNFIATSAKQTKIEEVIGCEDANWFLAKIDYPTVDEKTAKLKHNIVQMLVGANDFECAYNAVSEYMKDSMADWEQVSLSASPIIDVFMH